MLGVVDFHVFQRFRASEDLATLHHSHSGWKCVGYEELVLERCIKSFHPSRMKSYILSGGIFWGDRLRFCLFLLPFNMNIAALSVNIHDKQTRDLFLGLHTDEVSTNGCIFATGVLSSFKGNKFPCCNVDMGFVKGDSLLSILTARAHSMTHVQQKHDLELMFSGRNKLGNFRLCLSLSFLNFSFLMVLNG